MDNDFRFPVRKRIRLDPGSYQQGHVFFITIGAHERFPWFGKHHELADATVSLLRTIGSERKTIFYAWCVMPDHVHILLKDDNVIEFVRLFKGKMVPEARAYGEGRKLWQRSFYDHGIRSEESLSDIAVYIWENPVRKGLVATHELYLWSGSQVWPDWHRFYRQG